MHTREPVHWTIQDIERLCSRLGWQCLPPTDGGSPWKVTAADEEAMLTLPAKRPIKPAYVRKLLAMIGRRSDGEAN
jgi:hypothetical protein